MMCSCTYFARQEIIRLFFMVGVISACQAWLGRQDSISFLRRFSSFSSFKSEKYVSSLLPSGLYMTHDHHDFKQTLKQHQHSKNMIHFGNHLDIKIKLPTSDPKLVKEFLSRPNNIVTTIYDSKQAVYLPSATAQNPVTTNASTSNTWRIRFADIHIPAIDVLTPIIDIHFQFSPHNHTITMQSLQWTVESAKLRKSSPHSPPSLFDHSCHFDLHGILSIDSSIEEHRSHLHHHQDHLHPLPHNKPRTLLKDDMVATKGYVSYQITAEKPKFLQKMPQFVVDSAIKIVQNVVTEFVKKKFTHKMILAFQTFANEHHDPKKHPKH